MDPLLPASSPPIRPTNPAYASSVMDVASGLTQRSVLEEQFAHPKDAYFTLRGQDKNQRVWMDNHGVLFTKAESSPAPGLPKQYQAIGQVLKNGWFKLWNGMQGSIFNTPMLRVSPNVLSGPMGETLRLAERQLTQQSNEIPYIRQQLTNCGIDGRGVTIYCLEFLQRNKDGEPEPGDHLKLITSTLSDPQQGYAPGANAQMLLYQAPKDYDIADTDTPQSILGKMVANQVKGTDALAQRIQWVAQHGQRPSVVSFSVGTNPMEEALGLYGKLKQRDEETGAYKYPQLRQKLYGAQADTLTDAKKMGHLINWMTTVWQKNPDIQSAFGRYSQACQQLNQAGITLAIAMGNDEDRLPLGLTVGKEIPRMALFNWYCLPPSVVRVAAANNNATPGNVSDDTVTTFSTHGDNGALAPTVAATGQRVFIDKYFAPGGQAGGWSGTSVATPIVAATMALMLQQRPDLTPEQLRTTLQQSASRANTTVEQTGAGIIDPVKAALSVPS